MDTTRARLIAAAVRLFQSKGYAGTGVSEILEAADAPKGSMYHHYPDGKLGLAIGAVQVIAGEVDRTLAAHKARGLDAPAVLMALATDIAAWLEETGYTQGSLAGVLGAGLGENEERLRQALAGARKRWTTWFADLIGGDAQTARIRAQTGLAALEGAILLARTARDSTIVTDTARDVSAGWKTPGTVTGG
jgi:TetR/AcrR family transcriptional regulator, lmrAB and yxaGH operons repressor